MRKTYFSLFFLAIAALFLGGCSWPLAKKNSAPVVSSENSSSQQAAAKKTDYSGQMKSFANYNEVLSFLNSSQALQAQEVSLKFKAEESSPEGREALAATGLPLADVISHSGDYAAAIVDKDVYLIQDIPADQLHSISKMSFPSAPQYLYLSGNILVVIGNDDQLISTKVYKAFKRQSAFTFVKVFDISDVKAPKQLRSLDFEGSYLGSRLINGHLVLLIDNYRKYVPQAPISPRLVDGGKILSNDCQQNNSCYAPDFYYFDLPYTSFNFVTLNSLDLQTKDSPVSAQTYILSADQSIYLSGSSVYLALPQSFSADALRLDSLKKVLSDKLPANYKKSLQAIESSPADVLSLSDKEKKSLALFNEYLAQDSSFESDSQAVESDWQNNYQEAAKIEKTYLFKISLAGGQAVYRAFTSIPGIVFSPGLMSDSEGDGLAIFSLRHALENGKVAQIGALYSLSSAFKESGKLENIGPVSLSNKARFVSGRAYFGDFNEGGTIKVIGLGQSQSPRMLGSLTLSKGISDVYLDGNDSLLTLGYSQNKDAYDNISSGPLQLQLISLSDPANPAIVSSYQADSLKSDSLALSQPLSAYLDAKKNVFVLPISLSAEATSTRPYFSGALLFDISSSLSLKGRIDHSDAGHYFKHDNSCGSNCYDNSVRRSYLLADSIYTFSNKYLIASKLDDASLISAAKLLPDSDLDLSLPPLMDPKDMPQEQVGNQDNQNLVGPVLGPELPPTSTASSTIDSNPPTDQTSPASDTPETASSSSPLASSSEPTLNP